MCLQFGMWNQSMLHRSRNSGRDFWWNQLLCGPVLTPISCTKLKIHSAHEHSPIIIVPKQVPFLSSTSNLDVGPVYAIQIKKLRKRFFGGTSYLVGQFLHPSPVQSSRSIQRMQKVQLFLNIFFILHWQFGYGTSLCFTDQETQKEIFGGTSSLVGQFLHPSPVQSSRSIQSWRQCWFWNKF